jgi:hypothetical protein
MNETFEETMKRKYENIDEVKNLIHTSEWQVDNCEYDEKDGFILITVYKNKD